MFAPRVFALLVGIPLLGCTFDGTGLSGLTDGPTPGRDVTALLDQSVADRALQPVADAPSWDRQPPDTQPPDTSPPAPDTSPPDTGLPPCTAGWKRCSGSNACVDLAHDSAHCGQCTTVCTAAQTCSNALCCPLGERNCGGVCVDTTTSWAHCSGCNNPCAATQVCANSVCTNTGGCADGSDEQLFSQGMRGCAGQVSFAQRATLCGSGFRVCTAQEWIALRNGIAPQFNYWTNNLLNSYWGSGSNDCAALNSGGGNCGAGSTPMRICASYSDALGNECNWIKCGIGPSKANLYFGGCQGNKTAGALCCPL